MHRPWERIGLAAVTVTLTLIAVGDARPVTAKAPFWLSPVARRHADVIASLGAGQSTNWSGYNQGFLEKLTPFMSVSGIWKVPAAAQHGSGAQNSSAWVGIGGGCLDTSCLLTDPTLIQAGTNSDIDADGTQHYSTWWEIIPLPQINTPVAVSPNQFVQVDIHQLVPEVWTISLTNLSTGDNFTTTVPYPSTYGTVEWILETPTLIGTDGVGLASMPSLGTVPFSSARANGADPNLVPDEAIVLCVNGEILAAPSAPGSDSFSVTTYPGGGC